MKKKAVKKTLALMWDEKHEYGIIMLNGRRFGRPIRLPVSNHLAVDFQSSKSGKTWVVVIHPMATQKVAKPCCESCSEIKGG